MAVLPTGPGEGDYCVVTKLGSCVSSRLDGSLSLICETWLRKLGDTANGHLALPDVESLSDATVIHVGVYDSARKTV